LPSNKTSSEARRAGFASLSKEAIPPVGIRSCNNLAQSRKPEAGQNGKQVKGAGLPGLACFGEQRATALRTRPASDSSLPSQMSSGVCQNILQIGCGCVETEVDLALNGWVARSLRAVA
jgi:hypothetical protein